jgi:hypothetical protein
MLICWVVRTKWIAWFENPVGDGIEGDALTGSACGKSSAIISPRTGASPPCGTAKT